MNPDPREVDVCNNAQYVLRSESVKIRRMKDQEMYKNIFILCTGRCGSTTFIRACQHIQNYSSGHETRSHLIGEERTKYPTSHIEADNRLSWLLGRMGKVYGDEPLYVHLTRDLDAVARSYAQRFNFGIMRAYTGSGILMGCKENDHEIVASDLVHTVTSNIEMFLENKKNKLKFRMESAKQDFNVFWNLIKAEGDFDSAIHEFDIKYNATNKVNFL